MYVIVKWNLEPKELLNVADTFGRIIICIIVNITYIRLSYLMM